MFQAACGGSRRGRRRTQYAKPDALQPAKGSEGVDPGASERATPQILPSTEPEPERVERSERIPFPSPPKRSRHLGSTPSEPEAGGCRLRPSASCTALYRTALSHSESIWSSLPIISSTSPASMERGGATQIGRPRAIAGWRAAP